VATALVLNEGPYLDEAVVALDEVSARWPDTTTRRTLHCDSRIRSCHAAACLPSRRTGFRLNKADLALKPPAYRSDLGPYVPKYGTEPVLSLDPPIDPVLVG